MPCVTIQQVRNQIAGVTPYLDQLGASTAAEVVTDAIAAAERYIENRAALCIDKRIIKQAPGAGEELGTDYDEEESPHDYYAGSISRTTLPRWVLRRRPVISVERLVMQFTEGVTVIDIPTEWVKVNKRMGVVDVVPMGAAAAILNSSGVWFMPLIDQHWPWGVVPQFVVIDYTAGCEDPETDASIDDIRQVVKRLAAANVLEALQGLAPSSVNIDGFSQQFVPMDRRIEAYRKQAEADIVQLNRTRRPPMMVVL